MGAVAFDGLTRCELNFHSSSNVIVGNGIATEALVFNLWDDATDLGRLAVMQVPVVASGELAMPIEVSHTITPSSGAHTYKIRAWRSTGGLTMRVDAGPPRLPAYLRATRVD